LWPLSIKRPGGVPIKVIIAFFLLIFCGLLIYVSATLPLRGDSLAPMHRDQSAVGSPGASAYYIRNAFRDTATPNMVTAILADYRGYDTLGEETVILTAGLICYLLLRKKER